jgi:hypothetical protein
MDENENAIQHYLHYIQKLQKDFILLMEFCFDVDFYPELFDGLTAAERYWLYADINGDAPIAFERAESIRISMGKMTGNKMPFGMSMEDLKARLGSDIPRTKLLEEFEDKYGINGDLNVSLKLPKFLTIEYTVCTIYDMLYLEFTKMLELEIRLKKCGRCEKYFVMKGNYQTEYCDRIDEESGYSCQTLASQANYKSKLKENEAWALYNKYYKRYFARSKVGTIKEDVFRKWQYEATLKRDLCQSEDEIREFEEWLFGSFKNRGMK